MKNPSIAADDETCVTEITVQPDGRVYVFGTSREVLEILEILDPENTQLQRILVQARSAQIAGGEA